ncbi:MAG: ABC transporter ATP-binding protein [Candidatus Kapaibacterium sp.]|nr:MAG: ABC transporter ATP-binding protein [Candidatus Kapabacteria bacterium]
MIELRNITKRFGAHTVLNGLNLRFDAGSITAVLGPNGSGKTTLMKTILGLVRPDKGEVLFAGENVVGTSEYRKGVGYMPQIARFQDNLTARELVQMIRDVRENPSATREDELCERFHLTEHLDKPLHTLSGGTRQKVNAVLAFMFQPPILMLDEPTAGLDPISASSFKDVILSERNEGRTIVLTSHIMSEVQELADTIVFLLEGRVVFHGAATELLGRTGEKTLERAIARLLQESSSQRENTMRDNVIQETAQ